MKLRAYLDFICAAKTLEELWLEHVRQMGDYKFDKLLYGYTRQKTKTSLGDPEDFVILSNHCSEYVEGFVNSGLYFDAPMLHWALENDGPGSWTLVQDQISNGRRSESAQKVLEFNAKHVGKVTKVKMVVIEKSPIPIKNNIEPNALPEYIKTRPAIITKFEILLEKPTAGTICERRVNHE